MTDGTADTTTLLAPAKVNLTLHVTGQRADGYHLLDSLVAFADVGDRLALTPGAEMAIEATGPFAPGVPTDGRNLIWKAADLAGWCGHVALTKELPHAAGIGGGSSDAAAVLRHTRFEDAQAMLDLGADIPVCVTGRAARMQGIGDIVSPVALPEIPCLLINPGVDVPTGAVFSGLGQKDNLGMPTAIPAFPNLETCVEWLTVQRNDLEAPASIQAPAIGTVLGTLAQSRDVMLARMSGSGGTCFGIYPTRKAAEFAAYEIEAAHPHWWCRAAILT